MGSCHRGGTFTLFPARTKITAQSPKHKPFVNAVDPAAHAGSDGGSAGISGRWMPGPPERRWTR